jgi:hypothetical protein
MKFFQKEFQQDNSLNLGILKVKPRNKNQEYLTHSLNYRTLSLERLCEHIG